MEKIKSFFYLDNDKLKSLSSQMFGGITGNVINSSRAQFNEMEKNKGQFLSGNESSDANMIELYISENKFIHDYLFNKFEKELVAEKKLKCISVEKISSEEIKILDFVKITGKAVIRSSEKLLPLLKNYNELGKAIAVVSLNDKNITLNREQKRHQKPQQDVNNYVETHGLSLPKDFIDSLNKLLDFGINDLLEIQIDIDNKNYIALLNKKHLKEEEELFIRKFSRQTDAEINILGYVSKITNTTSILKNNADIKINSNNFKEMYNFMSNNLMEVEKSFLETTNNEIRIDPIGIYFEL